MTSDWLHVMDALPDDGRLLEVTTTSGSIRHCRRSGNLYWTPDMEMYVYYTPVMWRYVD